MKSSFTNTNFSIIIPFYKGEEFLETCLSSIISTIQEGNEIIVLINNKDKSVHNVHLFSDRVRYISVYDNLGYSKAVNLAVQYATHDYIIVCDQDVSLHQNWLSELWKTYCSRENVGLAGVNLINHVDNTVLDFGIASTGYNFMHPNIGLNTTHPLVSSDRLVQMVCSAVMLFSKTHFHLVGGLYESFGALYCDLDLCLRMKACGLNIIVSHKSIAYHFSGEYYPYERDYKNKNLKADIKGVFMQRNAQHLNNDAHLFFEKSYAYYEKFNTTCSKYLICNMMTVANPEYYENLMSSLGMEFYDVYRKVALLRDAAHIDLFNHLGRHLLIQGVPIAYFIDRFTSLIPNHYWWANRRNNNDIVIDRNANILSLQEILNS